MDAAPFVNQHLSAIWFHWRKLCSKSELGLRLILLTLEMRLILTTCRCMLLATWTEYHSVRSSAIPSPENTGSEERRKLATGLEPVGVGVGVGRHYSQQDI